MQQTQVSVYRTIGPLVISLLYLLTMLMDQVDTLHVARYWSEALFLFLLQNIDYPKKSTDFFYFYNLYCTVAWACINE